MYLFGVWLMFNFASILLLSEMVGSQCVLCEQPPRVATAFYSQLHHNLLVQRRSLQELQPFSNVSSPKPEPSVCRYLAD